MGAEKESRFGLTALYERIRERQREGRPELSYVARLSQSGQDAVLQKIGEECIELLLAAKGGAQPAMIHELADLHFHLLVWMGLAGLSLEDLEGELTRRSVPSPQTHNL
ncbi:MAG: phosphoribosyl-ATP diphosphatase [Deltaproteobacteria bacterium]|nr:phosphoribosyl-ATP diphosphatase [Deltaproteobacteria bacterium]